MLAADAYRTLYTRAPVPMVTVRADGQVIDANPVFCTALRSTPEAVVGSALVDLLAAHDRGACRVYLRQALERGEADWALSLASSSDQRWQVRAVSFAGQVAVLMLWTPPGSDTPATLVPALAALARRTPGQAVLLLSEDLWIVGAWGWAEIGGDEDDELVGHRLQSVLEMHPAALRALASAASDGDPWSGALDPEGNSPEAALSGHFLPAEVVGDHRHGAGFLVLRERAGRRGAPPDRMRLQRLARVGDFAVHLVEVVRDRTQALLRADPTSPEAETQRQELDALQHRLRQFVGVARAATEVGEGDVGERLVRRWGTYMKEEYIAFEVLRSEGDSAPPLAIASEVVDTVLDELVDNAHSAVMPLDDRSVRVEVRTVGTALEVAVEDSGPGIPPARRESIFRPFVTGWEGRLGLGLAIARAHLERAGGTVRFDDTSPRTRFVVSVPIHAPDRPRVDVTAGLRSPGLEDRSVMVIDEAEESRLLLTRALTTSGAEVREAWSVRSAVADLRHKGAVDGVVLTVGAQVQNLDRMLADLGDALPGLDRRTVVIVDRGVLDPESTERRFGCAVVVRPLMIQRLLDRLEAQLRND